MHDNLNLPVLLSHASQAHVLRTLAGKSTKYVIDKKLSLPRQLLRDWTVILLSDQSVVSWLHQIAGPHTTAVSDPASSRAGIRC